MNDREDARSVSSNDDPEYDIHADDFFMNHAEILMKSNDPTDKEALNQIITNAAETNNAGVYIQFLGHDYQMQVLNDKGQTAMHIAFYHGSDDVLQYAIEDDFNCQDEHINYKDCNGLTHLHVACDYSSEESDKLARKYMRSGEDVNACFENDPKGLRSGFTPLHMCVTSEKIQLHSIILLLKYGAKVTARDKLGRTPLHLACSVYVSDENLRGMEILLEDDSDVNAKDNEGNTPLHSVFLVGCRDKLPYEFSAEKMYRKYELLRDEYDADVTAINNAGDTILHCVIKNLKHSRCDLRVPDFDDSYHLKVIDEIFSSEKVDVNAKNNAGETFLQIAVSMLSVDIVSDLIKRDAKISDVTLSRDGRHCFYDPIFLPNLETVKNAISVIELLLAEGFEFTVKDQLAFMQFLLQDNRSRSWMNFLRRGFMELYLDNLLNFGTLAQVKRVYTQMGLTLLGKTHTHLKNKMYRYAKKWYLHRCEIGLFTHYSVVNFLKMEYQTKEDDIYFTLRPNLSKRMMDEAVIMINTLINDNTTLLSVLEEHPYNIYQRIKDVDLQNLVSKFSVYKNIVEGHLTKSVVRNCVEKMVTNEYLKVLLFPALPDICCRMIYSYLENEDILNVFSAATCEIQ